MVWNRLTQVRIMWYDDVCTTSRIRELMTPFCCEVASVFVCGKAGPWWRYRGPSTEEIHLRHPSDACPPAATWERQRIYQYRSPNFPEVYQCYPHSLCNRGLLPITNTLHHDNLVMKLHNGGKHESWAVNLHYSQAFLSSSFMAVGHGSIFSSGGQQAESVCSVAIPA